jgi:3-isopropylmalate/(R)-2-methylmalate dehydratase small subunit
VNLVVTGDAICIPLNHVNADVAMGWYMGMDSLPPSEIASKFFSGIDPNIARIAKRGDILVCGGNFGYGKVHTAFSIALAEIGISCFVAESFSTTFFKDGLSNGYLLAECHGLMENISTGDRIEVDFEKSVIRNITRDSMLQGIPLPSFPLEVMRDGGYANNFLKRFQVE